MITPFLELYAAACSCSGSPKRDPLEVLFATRNAGKVSMLQDELGTYGNITIKQLPMEFDEPRSEDSRKIALEKVALAHSMHPKARMIAEDSGFYIPSLNGFPKTFVHFTLGTIGVEGILKLLAGKPRACEFRDALAYMDSETEKPVLFEGVVKGTVAAEARGEMQPWIWSKISMLFIPEGYDKTLAEMSKEEYIAWTKSASKVLFTAKFAQWISKHTGE